MQWDTLSATSTAVELLPRDVVLWDGECELCHRAVQWIEKEDRAERFLPIPYQRAPVPLVGREIKEAAARSVHVIRVDGEVLKGGRATLYILERLGHDWARPLQRPPLVWLVEVGYHLVSVNRHWLSRVLFGRR